MDAWTRLLRLCSYFLLSPCANAVRLRRKLFLCFRSKFLIIHVWRPVGTVSSSLWLILCVPVVNKPTEDRSWLLHYDLLWALKTHKSFVLAWHCLDPDFRGFSASLAGSRLLSSACRLQALAGNTDGWLAVREFTQVWSLKRAKASVLGRQGVSVFCFIVLDLWLSTRAEFLEAFRSIVSEASWSLC